jgi:hypothetical protein
MRAGAMQPGIITEDEVLSPKRSPKRLMMIHPKRATDHKAVTGIRRELTSLRNLEKTKRSQRVRKGEREGRTYSGRR